jgi:hypothetical protein
VTGSSDRRRLSPLGPFRYRNDAFDRMARKHCEEKESASSSVRWKRVLPRLPACRAETDPARWNSLSQHSVLGQHSEPVGRPIDRFASRKVRSAQSFPPLCARPKWPPLAGTDDEATSNTSHNTTPRAARLPIFRPRHWVQHHPGTFHLQQALTLGGVSHKPWRSESAQQDAGRRPLTLIIPGADEAAFD